MFPMIVGHAVSVQSQSLVSTNRAPFAEATLCSAERRVSFTAFDRLFEHDCTLRTWFDRQIPGAPCVPGLPPSTTSRFVAGANLLSVDCSPAAHSSSLFG